MSYTATRAQGGSPLPRLAFALATLVLTLALAPSFTNGSPSSARAALAAPIVFQTDMWGGEQVPPVRTPAWGFVRFFFSEDKMSADYTVDVKVLSNTLVSGADIHRAPKGQNGPVIRHLADGNFIVTAGKMRFTPADLDDIAAGNWYVSLKSTNFPEGELRGQIVLPPGFWEPRAPVPAPVAAPPPVVVQPLAPFAPDPGVAVLPGSSLPVPAFLHLPLATCAGNVNVTFAWVPVAGATVQWLDLTVYANGFEPGTYLAAGPLRPGETTITWEGIEPGVTHYWRVNALTPAGWVSSAPDGFIACGA